MVIFAYTGWILTKETITGDEFMTFVNAENKKLTDGGPETEEPASGPDEAGPADEPGETQSENT